MKGGKGLCIGTESEGAIGFAVESWWVSINEPLGLDPIPSKKEKKKRPG